MAYQRMGSKLKNTIRQVNNVQGSQARFQKVGKGTAVNKARHSQIPTMDISHSTVDVTSSNNRLTCFSSSFGISEPATKSAHLA